MKCITIQQSALQGLIQQYSVSLKKLVLGCLFASSLSSQSCAHVMQACGQLMTDNAECSRPIVIRSAATCCPYKQTTRYQVEQDSLDRQSGMKPRPRHTIAALEAALQPFGCCARARVDRCTTDTAPM